MSHFDLTMRCDNAAFTEDPASEVADILERVAESLRVGLNSGRLWDVNGNHVGDYALLLDTAHRSDDA